MPMNDATFLPALLDDLSRSGLEAWVFGGWAEELLGLRPPGPHGDVDLLLPAADLAELDAWMRRNPHATPIPQKRFSHKRAAEYDAVRVEFLLLQPAGEGYRTSFFDGRFVHTWPADTLAGPAVPLNGQAIRVASSSAVTGYRAIRQQLLAALRADSAARPQGR
jgi:hypothetical protein